MTGDIGERRLHGEHIQLLHRQGTGVFLGQFLSAGILVWLLWANEAIGQSHLLAWFGVLTLVLALRWGEYRLYHAAPAPLERNAWWCGWFTVGAALTGLVWGYMGWAFYQPTLAFLFPVALVLAAQIALSVTSVGIYFPAHAVYNLLAMTPFTVRTFLEGGRLFEGQGFALLTLMIACLLFSWRQQALIRESIRLRFANVDLLRSLTEENEAASQARRQAEEANLAKSRFLAAASHDLRQPLQAISLFVDALADDSRARRLPASSLVDKLAASCESLETLLDSMLDLSQAEITALRPDIRSVPLQPLFDRIRHEFADQAEARGLRLRLVPTSHYVHTDPALLVRILRNLVVNALRYTERGGVLVGCRRMGDKLRIEVRDSGVGIPAHAMKSIFREFYQVGNPERDQRKGLGLGLAIVEALARQLSHCVTVRSAPGQGSVFAVELARGKPTRHQVEKQCAAPSDRLRGRWLAVIDDDPMVRDAIAALLGRWGCHVAVGETADDILSFLAAADVAEEPAAILADWRLREGRVGPEEARLLHAHFGHPIPTVLITGETAPDPCLGADFPMIHKPIQGFRLRAHLDSLLA